MLLQWLASWVIQCFKQSHMCCTRTLTYTSAREQTQKKAVSKKYPTFQLQNTLMVLITFLLSITYLQALKKNMTCILSQSILSVSLRTQALLHRQHEVKSLSMHPWIAWSCPGPAQLQSCCSKPCAQLSPLQARQSQQERLFSTKISAHMETCGAVLDWQWGGKADVGLLPLSWECLGGWHMFLTPTWCIKEPAEVNVWLEASIT